MQQMLETAGERVLFDIGVGWLTDLVSGSASGLLEAPDEGSATVVILVERDRRPFPSASWEALGRGVRRQGSDVVVEDVGRSGLDLLVRSRAVPPRFIFRWRPSNETRVLRASPARFRLRLRAALMQYPVLWRAATVARAPLHAACFQVARATALVVGTPGAGKSTALAAEAAGGGDVVSDNLCVADPRTVWGVVEPFRVERGSSGALAGTRVGRTTHGRIETVPARRLVAVEPDLIVMLRRGAENSVRDTNDGPAARLLVTSTYASGELRRFWPFAATLSMASGLGPAIPSVLQVARALTHRLPCIEVTLAEPGVRISDVLTEGDAAMAASVGVAG